MELQRGFKAEAKRIALEVRAELKLTARDPIDPYELAKLYGTKVCTLAQSHLPVESVEYFTSICPEKFSAALMPDGTGSIIIENHTHELPRRRSTMAHEMSHVLLEHEFDLLLASDNGCRSSSSVIEQEAAELSGELLIPWEGARWAAFRGYSDSEVATRFQVSDEMARWRMNATGVRKIALRARNKKNGYQ